jgi:CspA family cold shock protein
MDRQLKIAIIATTLTGATSAGSAIRSHKFVRHLGRKDVFVHISAVERAGFTSLAEGAKVSYDVVANRGKESAENLRVG